MATNKSIRRIAAVAGVVILAPLTACLGSGPSYAEGDCVTIKQQLLDHDLRSASCADAVGTFNAEDRTYRVNSIIDDTSGGCPELSGFFPIEFVHEPDGVTYCLVQADGS